MNQLVPITTRAAPALIAAAGERAQAPASSNSSPPTSATATPAAPTRRRCASFWRGARIVGLPSITAVQPVHVAGYIEELTRTRSAPTAKQRLAAIRHLFDWLVIGQVMPVNPASSVRGPTHVVKRGKTPVL